MTDLEKYDKLRKLQKDANSYLMGTFPRGSKGRTLLHGAAKALGYRIRNGAVDYPNEAAMDRLCEFLLYEPNLSGKVWAQCVLDGDHDLNSSQVEVVQAAIDGESTLYEVRDSDPDSKRIILRDILLDQPDFVVYDRGLSGGDLADSLMFSRVITTDGISFLSGASIGFGSEDRDRLLGKVAKVQRLGSTTIRRRKLYALLCKMEKFSSITVRFA